MKKNFIVRSFINLKHNTLASRIVHLVYCVILLIVIPALILTFLWHDIDTFYVPFWGKMTMYWEWIFFTAWGSLMFRACFLQKNETTGKLEVCKIPTSHAGGLMFFDQPMHEFGPGWVPAPPGFRLHTKTVEPQSTTMKLKGISTGSPKSLNLGVLKDLGINAEIFKDEDLHMQITNLEIDATVMTRLKRGSFMDFLLNLGSEQNFLKNLPNLTHRGAGKIFGEMTMAIAISNRDRVDSGVKKYLQRIANNKNAPWGIEIDVAQIDNIWLPPDVIRMIEGKIIMKIRKFLDVLEAKTRKKTVILDAEAQEMKEMLEGRGKAKAEEFMVTVKSLARELMLKAEAIGYGEIAKALNLTEGDLILKLEAMKTAFNETLSNANYSYLGSSDFGGILGFIPMLKDAITKTTPVK